MNKKEKRSGIFEYGVFVHSPTGDYKRDTAIKTYKSRKAAEKFADSRNLVVRGLDEKGRWKLPVDDEPGTFEAAKRKLERKL